MLKERACSEGKKKAEARLNSTKKRMQVKMIARAQNTSGRPILWPLILSSSLRRSLLQSLERPNIKPIVYNIPKRAKVVQLVCSPGEGLSDRKQFRRRIQGIEARTALCHRQDAQRRGRPKATIKQEESDSPVNDSDESAKDEFSNVCRPAQYPFCLGDESLPYHHRVYEYAKPHQMMNKAEKHLKSFAPADKVPCSHPQSKAAGLVLSSVMHLKNHTATVHKIFLRE